MAENRDMDRLVKLAHEALGGDGWAYSNYGMAELVSHRAELEEVVRVITAATLPETEKAGHGGEGWQPIETAPKNRKVLVAYRNPLGNWRIVTACYHTELPWSDDAGWDSESEFAPEAWYEESDSQDSILPTASAPSHWQPLPASPLIAESEDGR